MSNNENTLAGHLQPLSPLVEQLVEVCEGEGIVLASALPSESVDFVSWYRSTIAAMAAEVASQEGHTPMPPGEVALLCRCVLSAANLVEAITIAKDFCNLIPSRGWKLSLVIDGDRARFIMNSTRGERNALSSLVDTVGLLAYLQLFSWIVGSPIKLHGVSLACQKREQVAPLLGLFNAPVLVAALVYSFEFDAALLQQANVRSPAELNAFLGTFPCNVYGARSNTGLLEQVTSLIEGAIYQAREMPTLGDLAQLLSLSQTTLRRRLREEHSCYRQIREDCLCRVASELVLHGDWSNDRIAEHLGFSGAAAFRRAFQRWTGLTPSEMRQGQREIDLIQGAAGSGV